MMESRLHVASCFDFRHSDESSVASHGVFANSVTLGLYSLQSDVPIAAFS
jgi:hypothetical protein